MPPGLWQRFRYTIWAPHYDRVTKFHAERRRSIALLELAAGERVLLVGCGTGADLPFLPDDVSILATDYTRAMLDQARAHARPNIRFRQMDGRALDLPDDSFDAAILHMVLEVVPEPDRCLAEVARVLKPGGRAAVFDKFLKDGSRPAWPRRAALALLDTVFTATNRQLAEILAASRAPLTVVHDEPAGGAYRYVVLRKYPDQP